MEAFVINGYRSAVAKSKRGGFKNYRSDDLAVDVIKHLMKNVPEIDPKQVEENYLNIIPSKRFGDPEEIAFLATFLSSKKASYINGINLPVDGGFLSNL